MKKVYFLIEWYDKNRTCFISAEELPSWFSQGNCSLCVELDEDKNLFESYELNYKLYYGKAKWSDLKTVTLLKEGKKLKGLLENQEVIFGKGKKRPYLGKNPNLKDIGHFCELDCKFNEDEFYNKTKVIFCE